MDFYGVGPKDLEGIVKPASRDRRSKRLLYSCMS